jgi:hypothetical protein
VPSEGLSTPQQQLRQQQLRSQQLPSPEAKQAMQVPVYNFKQRRKDIKEGRLKESLLVGFDSLFRDGPCQVARFRMPAAIAFDPFSGCCIVTDAGNHLIRKLEPSKELLPFLRLKSWGRDSRPVLCSIPSLDQVYSEEKGEQLPSSASMGSSTLSPQRGCGTPRKSSNAQQLQAVHAHRERREDHPEQLKRAKNSKQPKPGRRGKREGLSNRHTESISLRKKSPLPSGELKSEAKAALGPQVSSKIKVDQLEGGLQHDERVARNQEQLKQTKKMERVEKAERTKCTDQVVNQLEIQPMNKANTSQPSTSSLDQALASFASAVVAASNSTATIPDVVQSFGLQPAPRGGGSSCAVQLRGKTSTPSGKLQASNSSRSYTRMYRRQPSSSNTRNGQRGGVTVKQKGRDSTIRPQEQSLRTSASMHASGPEKRTFEKPGAASLSEDYDSNSSRALLLAQMRENLYHMARLRMLEHTAKDR